MTVNGGANMYRRDAAVLSRVRVPSVPRHVLEALADLAVGVGPEKMCNLIKSSPAGDLLLPLRTALERELGLEPRVAREVEEIAEDIRRELLVRHRGEA